MAKGEGVHGTVRRIDGSMSAMNTVLRRFGAPKGVHHELRKLKRSVGDVISHLEMVERRSNK